MSQPISTQSLPFYARYATAKTLAEQNAMLPRERSRRREREQKRPNFYDRLVRRLQTGVLAAVDPRNRHRLTGRDVDRDYHIGLVERVHYDLGKRLAFGPLARLVGDAATARAMEMRRWIERWRRCDPVGDGSRFGQRCDDRFCLKCAALRSARQIRQITRRSKEWRAGGRIHLVRVARELRNIETLGANLDLHADIGSIVHDLRRSGTAAIRNLGPSCADAVVFTRIDWVKPTRLYYDADDVERPGGAENAVRTGFQISVSAWVMFEATRLPAAVYTHSWPHRSFINRVGQICRQMTRLLRVTPGVHRLDVGLMYALSRACRRVRTIEFRGRQRQDTLSLPVCTFGCEPRVSAAAECLLSVLGVPEGWLHQSQEKEFTLDSLSTGVGGHDGSPMPMKIVESSAQPELYDLLKPGAIGDLLRPHLNAASTLPVAVAWRRPDGMHFVCCPAEFWGEGPLADEGTYLQARFKGGDYRIVPLTSPQFVRRLWSLWKPPWAGANAKPPRFAPARPLHASMAELLTDGRGTPPRDENKRAVMELYKAFDHGRSRVRHDLGGDWSLLNAMFNHFGRRVMSVLPRCHGQRLDDVFSWEAGILPAALERLQRTAPYFVGCPLGMVFNLYRSRRRGGRPRASRRRVVLHDDAALIAHAGQGGPAAKILARVHLVIHGQSKCFYLQTTADFFRCLRQTHPSWVNLQTPDDKDQWITEQKVRKHFRELNQTAAFQRAVDDARLMSDLRRDVQSAENRVAVMKARASSG